MMSNSPQLHSNAIYIKQFLSKVTFCERGRKQDKRYLKRTTLMPILSTNRRQKWAKSRRRSHLNGVERRVKYNIQLTQQTGPMEGHFKVKTKLSWSPTKNREGVYVVRARLGKKLPSFAPLQLSRRDAEHRRSTSHSAAKNRNSSSKLFKNARIIDSTQTYLNNDKKYKENKTNGSSSPNSPKELVSSVPRLMVTSDRKRNRSNSGFKDNSRRKGNKDIQRTVAIAYKGLTQNVPVQNQLMTTLSRLILGDQKCQDDFYLEILGESSIHGDQENFIDFGDTDIFGEGGAEGIEKQLTI